MQHYSSNANILKFKSEVMFLASDRNSNCMENLVQDLRDSMFQSRLGTEAGEQIGEEYDHIFQKDDSNRVS